MFQGGPRISLGVGAGVPPPAGVRFPRPQYHLAAPLCLPRQHLPEAQILGQECGGRAERDVDFGTERVSSIVQLPRNDGSRHLM